VFLDIRFPSDSDNESSDGGEYLPDMEDDEEEEDYLDGGVDEYEFDVDELDMDVEVDESFNGTEDIEEECWLTDGSTLSDADLSNSLEEHVGVEEAEAPGKLLPSVMTSSIDALSSPLGSNKCKIR
jgi:hypothetical protein